MRGNLLECFLLFLLPIVSVGGLTSVRDNLFHENDLVSSANSNKSTISIISPIVYNDTPNSCLYVSPDLPPCHFIRNENGQRFYRSIDDSHYDRKRSNVGALFQGHVTVYSLQGCIPSRLPFKMALCESKESLERAKKIWKLYPFRIDNNDDDNDDDDNNDDDDGVERIGSTYVFPRFDINRWSKSMRLLRDERDREQRRKDVSGNYFKADQKYIPTSMNSLDRDRIDRTMSSTTSMGNRNDLTNSNEGIKRRRRGRRRRRRRTSDNHRLDRREIRQGSESPYSKSIPFDSKRILFDLKQTTSSLKGGETVRLLKELD